MKKQITVLAFGPVMEVVGRSSFAVNDVQTTEDLSNHLQQKFPALLNMNYAVAVNKQLVANAVTLNDGDTVALLPPFSGG